MDTRTWLDRAFYPQAVAIVGVSTQADDRRDYSGYRILRNFRDGGFTGRLYPINPHAESIMGFKAYPSVTAVPESIDLAIVAVPVRAVPAVLEDCSRAKIANIHICTSGFGESGLSEGMVIEARSREIAARGGLHVVGPNCLGYTVPAIGMNMYEAPTKDGPVAMLSQSGGHAQMMVFYGPMLDIGFSKVISYGNALVTDETDYLEYLREDPGTGIICMYIEGTRNGRKLLELVRQAAAVKPVVVWKGGASPAGARATVTHTSSLAGDATIWDSFFKQTGAIRVHSIDEMADVASTFLRIENVSSNGIVVITGGGGQNVADADICAAEGLEFAALSDATASRLAEVLPPINQSTINPIDSPSTLYNPQILKRILQILGDDPAVSTVIMEMTIFFQQRAAPETKAAVVACMKEFLHDYPDKALAIGIRGSELSGGDASALRSYFIQAGLAAYGSLRTAARALHRVSEYQRLRNEG